MNPEDRHDAGFAQHVGIVTVTIGRAVEMAKKTIRRYDGLKFNAMEALVARICSFLEISGPTSLTYGSVNETPEPVKKTTLFEDFFCIERKPIDQKLGIRKVSHRQ